MPCHQSAPPPVISIPTVHSLLIQWQLPPHSILFSSNPHTTGIVEEACFDQIDEFNDIDLFRCRPPPPPLTSVVPRALDTVEELLWLGSPTLAAYARQEI